MTRVTPFEPNGAVSREQFNLRVEEINEGIGEVAAQLGNIATVAVHSKAGIVHSLALGATATTGIQMVQFAATADHAEGDTWTVDGVVYTAKLQGEEAALPDKLFVAEDMVSVLLDVAGKRLGFSGVSNVMPDGSMALPVNDINIWQQCAGITSRMTTLAELVNNPERMAILVNSANAVNYMIRSTAIGQAVIDSSVAVAALDASLPITIPTMTSNTTPSGIASASAFIPTQPPYRAFTSGGDYLPPNYWTATSTSATIFHWVQYTFDMPIWVYKIKLLLVSGTGSVGSVGGKIQASNDGNVWTDITEEHVSPNVASTHQTFLLSPITVGRYKFLRVQTTKSVKMVSEYAMGAALQIWGK